MTVLCSHAADRRAREVFWLKIRLFEAASAGTAGMQ